MLKKAYCWHSIFAAGTKKSLSFFNVFSTGEDLLIKEVLVTLILNN